MKHGVHRRDLLFAVVGSVLALIVVGAQEPVLVLDGGIQFPDGSIQATAASTIAAPVRETGQTQCFNEAGTEIVCTGSGQDGDLRRGVGWPDPRFADNGDGTVTDNLTHLTWLKDAGCFGSEVTWVGSFTEIANFNSGIDKGCPEYIAGSFDDWRVANVLEMVSLINYGSSSGLPAGHPFLFTGTGLCNYWSSTSSALDPSKAWNVTFGQNPAEQPVQTLSKTADVCLWPVRSGQ